MITLNPEQQRAHDMILDFVRSGLPLFTIGGYAGTGKTTLIGQCVEELHAENKQIAFCAFTGKAAHVLKGKLCLGPDDYCGTIHGLIYQKVGETPRGKPIFKRVERIDHDLIILDEASMVDGVIFDDLRSYGVPILAVGDHGQLPPVQGRFNLMEHPEFRLETIVRQAEGNPIIKLSIMARESGHIPYGEYGEGISKVKGCERIKRETADIILCATNKTRVNINSFVRQMRGFVDPYPMIDEQVICLKNNREAGIFNGMIGEIKAITLGSVFHDLTIDFDNEEVYSGLGLTAQFGNKQRLDHPFADCFDWAYCITVHKSQGSEWPSVMLIEERMGMMDDEQWRRWLYTGITRAKERLLIMTR